MMCGRATLVGYSVSGRAVFPYFILYIKIKKMCFKYILSNIIIKMCLCLGLINKPFLQILNFKIIKFPELIWEYLKTLLVKYYQIGCFFR